MPTLARATVQRLDSNGRARGEAVRVDYNPTEYTLNKGAQFAEVAVPGLDSPILQFVRGESETLTLDLFFDSSEDGLGAGATPVTRKTDRFYDLVKIEPSTHAPPVCLFSWAREFPGKRSYGRPGEAPPLGNQQRFGFKCVIDSVRQRYTLFSTEGVPLRAVLTVSMREHKTLKEQVDELRRQSADHTHVHVVEDGETLSQIADRVYENAAAWRAIAEHNDVEDPLALPAGLVLEVPPAA
jgi:hypothetical protein